MNKNLDVITHAVTLTIKAAIMAARFSGRVRKRSLRRLAAMDADTKNKEILFLKDKVYQLEMQVSILQKRIQKRQNKPFIIFVPGTDINNMWYEAETREEMVHFPFWNHWPVAQVPNEGRNAVGPDRPSHSSLASQRAPHVRGEGVSQIIVSLYGMTENPVSKLVPLAQSWIYPAQLSVTSSGFTDSGYDKYQRAYMLDSQNAGRPSALKFNLAASENQPIVNPAFVIKNWGEASAELTINDKKISRGKEFRFGHRHTLESSDLIVWVKAESTMPVQITLSPVAD